MILILCYYLVSEKEKERKKEGKRKKVDESKELFHYLTGLSLGVRSNIWVIISQDWCKFN